MFLTALKARSTGAGDGVTNPGLSWRKPRVLAGEGALVTAGWLFAGGA